MSAHIEELTIKTRRDKELNLSVVAEKTNPNASTSTIHLKEYLEILLALSEMNTKDSHLIVTPEFAMQFDINSELPIIKAIKRASQDGTTIITSAKDTKSDLSNLIIFKDGVEIIIPKGLSKTKNRRLISLNGIQIGVEHCYENQIVEYRLRRESLDFLIVPAHKLLCTLLDFPGNTEFGSPNLDSVAIGGHALYVDGYYSGANNSAYVSLTQNTSRGPKPLFHNAN